MPSGRTSPSGRLAVWLAASCLAACSGQPSRPDTVPAVAVPAGWSTAAAGGGAAAAPQSLASWWQRFDDPLLATLVERALQHNTRVEGAQAALQQAQALRDVAAAALWPTLNATASAQHGTAGGHSSGSSYAAGLGAAWTPDLFGARRGALRAEEAALQASAATLGDTQLQVAAEVALDYVLLRASQARLAIANDNLASQLQTAQITEWRQQAGLVTALDVLQARTAAEQTRAALPALQTAIEQTQHALAVLAGQPPADLAQETAALPAAVVPQARDAGAVTLPAETLRRRADVRASEYQVAAALAQVDVAQAQRWPSFAISGSFGLNALSLGALGHSASVLSSVLASVSLPLFDGGALRAQVRVQQAALCRRSSCTAAPCCWR